EEFVHDCINEFGLFNSDGEVFWSESLLRRMAIKEEISQKRKKAAEARWGKAKNKEKKPSNMQVHSNSNANGMQGKESKGKERKKKENKRKYLDNVLLKKDEYKRIINEFGQEVIDSKIDDLDTYISNKGKNPYKDHNKTLRNWIKKDGIKPLSVKKQEQTRNELIDRMEDLKGRLELPDDYYEMNGTSINREAVRKELSDIERQLHIN